MTAAESAEFARQLLEWHARCGRHDLPWQRERSPYSVWLSEIMLQQTQVTTVIPYFECFIGRFPDVVALAVASTDEVLHLWSGLGYYSRARNLHKTAQLIVERHAGQFPGEVAELCELPGIGRSTAGAIVALANDRRAAILDGNVKRVLARYHAIAGWPGLGAVGRRLWELAEAHLPAAHFRDYTQAFMDLGATLCTRRRPVCADCPVRAGCAAYSTGRVEDYPAPRPRSSLPRRETCFLIFENERGGVLLERRPPLGVWGGLWCFPELEEEGQVAARASKLGVGRFELVERLPAIKHTFTHFHLNIQPLRLRCVRDTLTLREGDDLRWYTHDGRERLGLSAPVTRLLKTLRPEQH